MSVSDSIRVPSVAGRFYPSEPAQCLQELETLKQPEFGESLSNDIEECVSQDRVVGGVFPHAGWGFSGGLGASLIRIISRVKHVETLVMFGVGHRYPGPASAVDNRDIWQTPLGVVRVDQELARAAVADGASLVFDGGAHEGEHSLEVVVPMVAHLMPKVRILPVLVPANDHAPSIGQVLAEAAARVGRLVLFLGSTDLTHYGPRFGFSPKGRGAGGLSWAREVNDRTAIELMKSMDAARFLIESRKGRCACGGGPVSAALTAMKLAGADRGIELGHWTSTDSPLGRSHPEEDHAVGYAALLFVR